MKFWLMAWNMGLSEEKLRKAVITEENKYGYITKEEFKEITKKDFDVKVEPEIKDVEKPAVSNPL